MPETALEWISPSALSIVAPWFSAEVAVASPGSDALSTRLSATTLASSLIELPVVQASSDEVLDSSIELLISTSDEALADVERSKVRGLEFVPVCAYTRVRRHLFADLAGEAPSARVPRSVDALKRCLQQSWYVTANSVAELSKGLADAHPVAFRRVLSRYVDDERGHHRFIEKSLSTLGASVTPQCATPGTRRAMSLLGQIAERNPFGLAVAITYFEMGAWLESDPIADALRDAGFGEAAKPIQAHFDLNKSHAHASVPLEMIRTLDSVPAQSLIEAVSFLREISDALHSSVFEALNGT